MLVLLYNDDYKNICYEQIDQPFLFRRVAQLIYGPNYELDPDETHETEATTDELMTKGFADLGEGYWLATVTDIVGLSDFLIMKYKEMREERDYEDGERVKALKERDHWRKLYEELQGSLVRALGDTALRRLQS